MTQKKSSTFSQTVPAPMDKLVVAGLLWFVAKGVFDVLVNSDMRFLSDVYGYHPFQLVFFYSAIAAAAYLPSVIRNPGQYRTERPRLYIARGVLEVIGFTLIFTAVTMMPFAMFTVLTFITPVIASLVAVRFLGEEMTARKWIGLALGFTGVVIVSRPEAMEAFNLGVLLIIGAAFCFAFCAITIRSLARTEPPSRIAFVTLVLMALFSLPLAIPNWQTPTLEHVPYLALLAIGAAGAQFCVGMALQRVDVTTVQPIGFLTLIWSSVIGFLWFDEVVEWATIIGAVCIVAGITYSVRRPTTYDRVMPGTQPTP